MDQQQYHTEVRIVGSFPKALSSFASDGSVPSSVSADSPAPVCVSSKTSASSLCELEGPFQKLTNGDATHVKGGNKNTSNNINAAQSKTGTLTAPVLAPMVAPGVIDGLIHSDTVFLVVIQVRLTINQSINQSIQNICV